MATCYDLHLGAININYSDLPCEDVSQVGHNVTCCVRGSVCMSNGICQNADKNGYYSADCTDPTLQDPKCQNRCGRYLSTQNKIDSVHGVLEITFVSVEQEVWLAHKLRITQQAVFGPAALTMVESPIVPNRLISFSLHPVHPILKAFNISPQPEPLHILPWRPQHLPQATLRCLLVHPRPRILAPEPPLESAWVLAWG